MKRSHFLLTKGVILLLILVSGKAIAQPFTETFEAAANTTSNTIFSSNGVGWTITGGNYAINADVTGYGWSGTAADDKFIDNNVGDNNHFNHDNDARLGNSGSIKTSSGSQFVAKKIWVYGSCWNNVTVPGGGAGTLTITGKLASVTQFTITILSTQLNSNLNNQNGFTPIDFATWGGVDNSNIFIDELACSISNVSNATTGWTYVAFDAFTWCSSGCGSNTTINSLTRASTNPTNAGTVNYTATFGASITTISASNFSVSTSAGITGATVTGVSGTGATRTVAVNTGSGDGTLTLSLNNSTSMSPGISTTLPFAGEVYTIDKTAPTVSSINRVTAATTNASSVNYTVTFSESVTGVDVTDFTLNGVTGTVSNVSGSGNSYTVTVSSITGDGTQRLDLKASGTGIADAAGNAISGGFTIGQSYTFDHTVPTVTSINRVTAATTNASSVDYTLTFSESVTGVSAGDFTLNGVSGTLSNVSGSGTTYTITVSSITGNGTQRLDLNASGTGITDAAGNASGGYTSGQQYTFDHTTPFVSSISRVTAATTNASSVDYTVTFSESVTGVDATDFSITGVSGTISNVAGSGTTYTITVSSISGEGTQRLDLKPTGTGITDAVSNAISGGFTTGQQYTFDHIAPTANSINRVTASTTNASSVDYTLTFSEGVTGVDVTDFTVTGVSGTVSNVSGSGTTYTITVNTITGDGTQRLDLKASGTGIADLAGNAISGGFTTGQQYTFDHTAPFVSSINRVTAVTTNASSVDYTVTFSESVTGVSSGDFTLNGVSGTASNVSGSGTTYTITVSGITGDGTQRLDLNASGTGITDASGNASGGFISGQQYTFDHTAPFVSSINRVTTATTNAASVDYTVTFSEAVTGVDVTDFTLNGVSGSISGISGSGTTYTITVSGITGNGAQRLDLNVSGTGITDAVSNAISAGYTSGQQYTFDHIAPFVSSINRANANPTNATSVDYTVTFSENVTGVDVSDFVLSGSGVSGTISGISGSGSTYTITVSSLTGDGTLGLDLNSSGTGIADAATNAISGGYTSGQQYTRDATPPSVISINRANTNPTNATSVDFTVTFSKAVTGVDMSDFAVAGSGVTGSVSSVSGSGSSYTVTVNSVSGDGTLGLNLNGSGTGIIDASTNDITGGFTGQTYTIDQTAPFVSSIVRAGSTPTNATSVSFTVTFSEAVTGVDMSDLTLTNSGVTGTIASVTGSGNSYTVTVNAVNGDGTMRLDLNASGTGIADAATNAIGGGYTAGQSYTIDQTAPVVMSVSVPADGNYTTGQTIDLVVNLSEPVSVTGSPYINITLQSGTVQAGYSSGTGSAAITFRYTVGSGDVDANGITVASAITLNGGTIQDAATNNTNLTLNSVGATNNILVNNTLPTFNTGTSTSIHVCSNAPATNITSLLHVSDINTTQTETWTILTATDNGGTLTGFSTANTTASGSTNLTPGNAVTYTPATGFVGTETFTIQVSDGYATGAITVTVSVDPLPVISSTSSNSPVCSGNSLNLSGSASGGTGTLVYSWTGPNGFSAGGATPAINPASLPAAGTYTLVVTDDNSCRDTSTTTTIVSYTAPIAGVVSIMRDNTTRLSDATPGGVWSSSNSGVATISSTGVVSGTTLGQTTIAYTVGSNCPSIATVTVYPVVPCVGQTMVMSDSVSGGTWSTTIPAVATVNATTGLVYNVNIGTTVIKHINTAYIRSYTVTVNPLQPTTGPSAVCQGSTVTLGNNTAGGGTWSTSNVAVATAATTGTGVNGTFGGVSGGFADAIYLTPAGCLYAKAMTVNPTASITGITTVCVSQAVMLSNAVIGGTWSSSTPSIATVSPNTGLVGNVVGITAGTSVISYNLPTGCLKVTTVTVNPLSATTGTTTICQGLTTTLGNLTTGGGTWSSSNSSVATITGTSTSAVASSSSAGTTNIIYTSTKGCIYTKTLTVNPVPAISGIASVCVAQTTMLSSTTTGGTWNSSVPGMAGVNITTGLVSGVSAGSPLITYGLPTGCIKTVTMTVNPLVASTGAATLCNGHTMTLANSTTGGGTWSSANSTVATIGLTTGVMSASSLGNVSILFTTNKGCVTTKTVTVNTCPAREASGTTEVEPSADMISAVKLYPNPNTGTFTVTGTLAITDDQEATLTVVNMLGQIVYRHTMTVHQGNMNEELVLDNALANGTYMLNIRAGSDSKVIHFVVTR